MAVQPFAWDNDIILEQNRRRLLKDMRRRMRSYEARYELSSDRLEVELSSGRLRETAEICDWVIAVRTFNSLNGA